MKKKKIKFKYLITQEPRKNPNEEGFVGTHWKNIETTTFKTKEGKTTKEIPHKTGLFRYV